MRILSIVSRNGISANALVLAVCAFMLASGNATFIANVVKAYPPSPDTVPAMLSLLLVFGGATVLMLAPFCFRLTTKPLLAAVLVTGSVAAYFMDTYGVVVSDDMLRSVAQTHGTEATELLSLRLAAYVLLLGVLPALAVLRVPVRWQSGRAEAVSRLKLSGITLAVMAAATLAFGSFYASFFRAHRELRQHANPAYPLYSSIKFASRQFDAAAAGPLAEIGGDAVLAPHTGELRELVIMVVGETARADRFSLNGYARETNPRLREKRVISFTNFRACGTSTAVSVPCMFLLDGEAKGPKAIAGQENLLDVLKRSGVNVLWLDNNSDSKGVAARVEYRDFRSPKVNPACDIECRDEGMLAGLQEYIDAHPAGDIFIVLHQMGNHGPAYHRRYPAAFEQFTPACRESDLSRCSREEIGNAYDNAIRYTDHFLAKTIELLQRNDDGFETAMFYVSDHGESLGENGVYLHGLPKAIAPEAQLRVPAIMWFGRNFHGVTPALLRHKTAVRYTHSNVFHTILGFFEIRTSAYVAGMDVLHEVLPIAQR